MRKIARLSGKFNMRKFGVTEKNIQGAEFDKRPNIGVPGSMGRAWQGWTAIGDCLRNEMLRSQGQGEHILAIECYNGVFEPEIRSKLQESLGPAVWIESRDAFLSSTEIDRLVAPYLGGDDPVFGCLSPLVIERLLSAEKLRSIRAHITGSRSLVVVIGPGASLVAENSAILVYADMPRREVQHRQRRGEISNLGVSNRGLNPSLQYKRSYFVDWRACDRLKQQSMGRWDFLLDTTLPGDPKLVTGDALRAALRHCVTRPFRLVPFFDPGPWGGQWMREMFDLDTEQANFAWCFDCVPEENSLLLQFGVVEVELPSIDLVLAEPEALLGGAVYARFGAEFPIRFDLLDTMSGGNLSLQVHPLTQYVQEHFGMRYTQDESYYLLDARPGAVVYLGRRRGTQYEEMIAALEAAHLDGTRFDDERFIARFAARRHDHFLIPAGTLHCSGANCMVLEISATPYIFTFKLWDWQRMGLDGKPRPINIERGKANICWERDEDFVMSKLINQISKVADGKGWREEKTGLDETQFIETRRHWFTGPTPHNTGGEADGGVNVLNLVEGEEAIVESPDGSFEPFVVHYAETFVVPAAVGAYCISPFGRSRKTECATIKAYVRPQI